MSPACSDEPASLVVGTDELGFRKAAAVEPSPDKADKLKLVPPKVSVCAAMALTFRMSFELTSKSEVSELGVLPSNDRVLSKASLKATKLALS
tara:strand:- start:218 stop:496 length:279 start_codon:yes stop_codon:yes gene_type:complete